MRAPGAAVQGLLEIPFALPGTRAVPCCTMRRVLRNGFFASPGLSGIVSSWVLPCSRPASACPALGTTWSNLCRGVWAQLEVLGHGGDGEPCQHSGGQREENALGGFAGLEEVSAAL